jgi:hypothetical protein
MKNLEAESTELSALVDGLAAEAGDVDTADATTGREYSRGQQVFAATHDGAVELRLHPEVAQAAARTPDTQLSQRGPGWVRFSPAELDGHARDRVRAWFMSAWRAAEGRPTGH